MPIRSISGGRSLPAVLVSLFVLLGVSAASAQGSPEDSRDPLSDRSRSVWRPEEGTELLGSPAPEWRDLEWIQGGPLLLEELRGKAVLLKFWLVDCPYCRRTAPALVELANEYGDRELVVVGIHHPKSAAAKKPDVVRRAAERLGFDFPIALDNEWSTIRAYGVGKQFRRFTSVSFLIGPEGRIRWLHDGGAFRLGGGEEGRAYKSLVAALERWVPAPEPRD